MLTLLAELSGTDAENITIAITFGVMAVAAVVAGAWKGRAEADADARKAEARADIAEAEVMKAEAEAHLEELRQRRTRD